MVKVSGTVAQLISDIKEQCFKIACHLFDAVWQYRQLNEAKANLQTNTLLMVLDFAENYRTIFQDEVQNAHWNYRQVTVHPLVTYYKCPVDGCEGNVIESIVCLSGDLIHDANAVKAFTEETLKYLREERNMKFEKVIQFTDGAASQYKSRIPFTHIANGEIPIERSFFGSRHGKSPADGVSGVRGAVQGKKAAVKDEDTMFTYLENNLSIVEDGSHKHTLRTFILVKDIQRGGNLDVGTAPGTQQIHSTRSCEAGCVEVRMLSCCCKHCSVGDCHLCINAGIADPWKKITLDKKITFSSEHLDARRRVFTNKNGKSGKKSNKKGKSGKKSKASTRIIHRSSLHSG